MPFELVGKRKAKLTEVNIQSMKLGQTELKPAISLRWKVTLPNVEALNMLGKTLLPFLYEKNSAAKTQGTLEGVPVVSDMPQLTEAARRIGAFPWRDEQTGCKLIVYQGVTGDMNITLRDGTRTIQKVDPHEGGTVDVTFDFDAADLDAETMGELAVLKNHEPDIELTAPEVLRQGRLDGAAREDDEEEQQQEEQLTPEKALSQALQQDHEGKPVTVRPPAGKKAPVAKKIARHAAKQSRRGAKA